MLVAAVVSYFTIFSGTLEYQVMIPATLDVAVTENELFAPFEINALVWDKVNVGVISSFFTTVTWQ